MVEYIQNVVEWRYKVRWPTRRHGEVRTEGHCSSGHQQWVKSHDHDSPGAEFSSLFWAVHRNTQATASTFTHSVISIFSIAANAENRSQNNCCKRAVHSITGMAWQNSSRFPTHNLQLTHRQESIKYCYRKEWPGLERRLGHGHHWLSFQRTWACFRSHMW